MINCEWLMAKDSGYPVGGSMKLFSIHDEHVLLSDTPRCRAEVRSLEPAEQLGGEAAPAVETILCVLAGAFVVTSAGEQFQLTTMQGVQLPAGQAWRAQSGPSGARLLQIASFHPHFIAEQALMAPLEQAHRFAIADDQWLVYTDYVRGGVLNFAPHFAADKHFHQDADEIFWFFQGTCRVGTPAGEVLCPAGSIIYTEPGEWHIIENASDEPLLMFLTVTPNIVPSHTFFDATGAPRVRSWAPLQRPR